MLISHIYQRVHRDRNRRDGNRLYDNTDEGHTRMRYIKIMVDNVRSVWPMAHKQSDNK